MPLRAHWANPEGGIAKALRGRPACTFNNLQACGRLRKSFQLRGSQIYCGLRIRTLVGGQRLTPREVP